MGGNGERRRGFRGEWRDSGEGNAEGQRGQGWTGPWGTLADDLSPGGSSSASSAAGNNE